MHFMFEKPGFDHFTTALYTRGDPYETSDAVFGMKGSLLLELHSTDKMVANGYDVIVGSAVLEHDFVLVTEKEAFSLR